MPKIRAHSIQVLKTFSEAEQFWATANAWKDSAFRYRRPLGNRRAFHEYLEKSSDGYRCVLYETPLVIYYANSIELQLDDRMSSRIFTDRIAPTGCQMISVHGRSIWKVNTPEGQRYYNKNSGYLEFDAAGFGVWQITSKFDELIERVLDRRIASQAQKIVRPYKLWYEATERLSGAKYSATNQYTASEIKTRLWQPNAHESYAELAKHAGTPSEILKRAYGFLGAYKYFPVPTSRLPKRRFYE